MNRLTKELTNRGIIYEAEDYLIGMGPEYDNSASLAFIDGDFLVTIHYSAVLDPTFRIYDAHTLTLIGVQNRYLDIDFNGGKTWGSYAWIDEEESDSCWYREETSNCHCDTYGVCGGYSCPNYWSCQA